MIVCVLSDLTWLPILGGGRKSWYIIIIKIEGADRFTPNHANCSIFYTNGFLYVSQKMSIIELSMGIHTCYFLFNTFFSWMNNKTCQRNEMVPLNIKSIGIQFVVQCRICPAITFHCWQLVMQSKKNVKNKHLPKKHVVYVFCYYLHLKERNYILILLSAYLCYNYTD